MLKWFFSPDFVVHFGSSALRQLTNSLTVAIQEKLAWIFNWQPEQQRKGCQDARCSESKIFTDFQNPSAEKKPQKFPVHKLEGVGFYMDSLWIGYPRV